MPYSNHPSRLLRPLLTQLKGLFRHSGGNVTILFSVALIGLLACAGAAVDYVRLDNQRTALAATVDATALAGITGALQAEKSGKEIDSARSSGQKAAQSMWNANVGSWLSDLETKPTISVSRKGKTWQSEVTFDGNYATNFMNLVGIRKMRLYGHAVASSSNGSKTQSFWQFHVVVDTSNSMGIGATKADMSALTANPQIKCSFACHYTGKTGPFKNTVAIAEAAGIRLRIDVVRDAIASMMTQMKSMSDGTHVKARLVGLDRTANELVAMTTNLEDIADYDIQLTPALPDGNMSTGDTDYFKAMSSISAAAGTAGDGSSEAKAKKAVFIVTDGVHDSYVDEPNAVYDWTNHHFTGPIDPAFCAGMKASGVTVGVLYIDYIPPTGYEFTVTPFQSSILPNLKACASDGLFYNATSPDGIKAAMSSMLADAMAGDTPRLTQ
jgi:Flp pilus assembly protein TadG